MKCLIRPLVLCKYRASGYDVMGKVNITIFCFYLLYRLLDFIYLWHQLYIVKCGVPITSQRSNTLTIVVQPYQKTLPRVYVAPCRLTRTVTPFRYFNHVTEIEQTDVTCRISAANKKKVSVMCVIREYSYIWECTSPLFPRNYI